jgi:hypothetical protein
VAHSSLVTALTNISFLDPDTREESLPVIAALIEEALRAPMREFDAARWGEDPLETLSGPQGHVGYLGHLNWMLGAYRFLGGDGRFDTVHQAIAAALARRLRASPIYCAETYPGETYLPDNVVVLASLRNADPLFGTQHGEVAARWLTVARERLLDPRTGLLVFGIDRAGNHVEGSRGSGAGWNSLYLPFIHQEFAKEQYTGLQRHLVRHLPFGLMGVREYPHGVFRFGDVDSGPVLAGLSPSGTGFAVAGARHAGDVHLLGGLLLTTEAVGSSIQWHGRRRYLFAPLVGEAIMLATKTAVVWDTRFIMRSEGPRHQLQP